MTGLCCGPSQNEKYRHTKMACRMASRSLATPDFRVAASSIYRVPTTIPDRVPLRTNVVSACFRVRPRVIKYLDNASSEA